MTGAPRTKDGADMQDIFQKMEQYILGLRGHIDRLSKTMDIMRAQPEIFSALDIQKVEETLALRAQEERSRSQEFGAFRKLYTDTVVMLEEKVASRGQLLQQLDAELNVISIEDNLRIHFAEEQAALMKGLADAKARLFQQIRDRFGNFEGIAR